VGDLVQRPIAPQRALKWASVVLALAASLGCDDDDDAGDNPFNCDQGTFSIETTTEGAHFAHPDGTPVTATFGSRQPQTATTRVQDGAFSVSFAQPDPACNLGGSRVEPVALYIDGNGDGRCTLAEDDVFIWTVFGGPSGGKSRISLSPTLEPCATGFSLSSFRDVVDDVRDALRRLCPEVGDCLPLCRPPDPPGEDLPDGYGGFCGSGPAAPDAGVP